MVLYFQRSCFEMPKCTADEPRKKTPTKKVPKRKFHGFRKQQMEDVVSETRIWALACALPLRFYAPKSCTKFTAHMEGLARRIFGPQISERKIRAVFGRMGLDLLALPQNSTQLPQLSDNVIEKTSHDWLVPYSIIEQLRETFPGSANFDFFSTSYLTWDN